MKDTLSVVFHVKPLKDGCSGTIYARIIVNQLKAEIATTHKIRLVDWNKEKQEAKSKSINEDLIKIKNGLHEVRRNLLHQKAVISAKLIKDIFTGEKTDILSLERAIAIFLEFKGEQKIATATHKNYAVTMAYLYAYLRQSKQEGILLKEVTYKFINHFDLFLSHQISKVSKKPLHRNYINKHHSRFRAILQKFFLEGELPRNPYHQFKLKADSSHQREYLTQEELLKLQAHTLGDNLSLQRVRDIFLFSVYTGGLRFSDAMKLHIKDFLVVGGRLCIKIAQTKTNEAAFVPLFSPAVAIYEKYLPSSYTQESGYLLPKISNAKLNTYLRVIADFCGIKKHISHHVARHTFATTIMLSNGASLEDTSKLLGHKSIRTTAIYGRIVTQRLLAVTEDIEQKLAQHKRP